MSTENNHTIFINYMNNLIDQKYNSWELLKINERDHADTEDEKLTYNALAAAEWSMRAEFIVIRNEYCRINNIDIPKIERV